MSCVLAAVAVGVAMGIPLATAVQAVEQAPPRRRRMYPITRPDEVTFIQDDMKAPLWSIPPALEFMQEAQAGRKIVVVGSISDYKGNSDQQYVSVARQARDVADTVIFIGPRASKCLKARRHPHDDSLQAFNSVDAAGDYLDDLLRPGDVVLLKGAAADHLDTLITARTTREEPAAPAWPTVSRQSPNILFGRWWDWAIRPRSIATHLTMSDTVCSISS